MGYPGNCQFSSYAQCMATASGTDAYCGINPQTISDYVAKGVIVKLASGNFDIDECRNRTFAYLREKAAGHCGDLTNKRALLAKEQRDALLTGRAGGPRNYPTRSRQPEFPYAWGNLLVRDTISSTVASSCFVKVTVTV
jgi:hypothetical protein